MCRKASHIQCMFIDYSSRRKHHTLLQLYINTEHAIYTSNAYNIIKADIFIESFTFLNRLEKI